MCFLSHRCLARALSWWAAFLTVLLFAGPALAERVHVVASGHTLGKIAKRYNISIEEICTANQIRRRDPLKVGQRIVIPEKDDAATPPHSTPSKQHPSAPDKPTKKKKSPFTTHVVSRGHTLGKIARRYRTTVDAICDANGFEPRQSLKIGACLVVPLTQRSTEAQRSRKLPCISEKIDIKDIDESRRPNDTHASRPSRSGVVHIVRGGHTFRGRLFNRRGRSIKANVAKVDALLFDRRTNHTHSTDTRLLRRIAEVSDHFGGRRLIVVSGYREKSSNPYTSRSKHALGRAIDFRVEGVPNKVLCDYLHGLSNVGVGYYPNSSFVHLDVRRVTTHWTDVSGPGEPPRYTSMGPPKRKKR
ncbi:MAG: hypothetical protein CSA75_03440 [Sorangium cellulosum]|nr:MAG: hypothetical protein CSA75_03440 [Sorangium cellulosum]